MRKVSVFGFLLVLSGMFLLATAPGCGSKKEDKPPPPPSGEKKAPDGGKAAGPSKGKAVPLVGASYDGVIKGKVVYDGPPPKATEVAALVKNEECKNSPADQKVDQTWRVSKEGGVENAVIFLRPPPRMFFALKKEQVKVNKEVVMDQPFCVYLPRVIALFPGYRDETGADQETGQGFTVRNNAKFPHNVAWKTPDAGSTNKLLPAGTSTPIKDFVPQLGLVPYEVGCNIHNWMRAYVWSFDHPFFAVTDKDGNFEIHDVPTGVEVMLLGWHEATQVFDKAGAKINLKKGETLQKEFKIKTP